MKWNERLFVLSEMNTFLIEKWVINYIFVEVLTATGLNYVYLLKTIKLNCSGSSSSLFIIILKYEYFYNEYWKTCKFKCMCNVWIEIYKKSNKWVLLMHAICMWLKNFFLICSPVSRQGLLIEYWINYNFQKITDWHVKQCICLH